jgi:uncharacterized membrane protein YkvA (DUF1232 family)
VTVPIDALPELVLPVVGKIDDLVVIAVAVAWALKYAPVHVVDEHLAEMGLTRSDVENTMVSLLPMPVEAAVRRMRAG